MEIDKETLAALIQQGVEKALAEREQQKANQTAEEQKTLEGAKLLQAFICEQLIGALMFCLSVLAFTGGFKFRPEIAPFAGVVFFVIGAFLVWDCICMYDARLSK